MELPTAVPSLVLVLVVSTALVAAGLARQPGLGALAAVIVVGLTLAQRGEGLGSIGFGAPASWLVAVFGGLALGVAMQLLSVALIEPWAESLTGARHDHGVLAGVRGNWRAFALWMVLVWGVAAFVEEGLYRGYLVTELARALGTGPVAAIVNVAVSAVVFGLSHAYQGRAGVLSTTVVGAILATVFIADGYNVWMVVFAHGFIDTIGIALVAAGFDQRVGGVRRTPGRDGR